MDYPKSTPGVGLVNGQFVDENKTTGTPGSLIPAKWGNDVTNELLAVIKAAGFDPAEDQSNQLLEAIRKVSLRVGPGIVSGQRPILVSPTVGTSYQDSALEIREALAAGAEAVGEGSAPSISFHWGTRTANRLWMDLTGKLRWGADVLLTAVADASEAVRGLLRIGTQAEVNAGALDSVAVTPKKLRAGFALGLASNGYAAFPFWLGGLIIQWGLVQIVTSPSGAPMGSGNGSGGYTDASFPIAFPGAALGILASQNSGYVINGGFTVAASILSRLGARFLLDDANNSAHGTYYVNWIAIGY